MNKNTRCARSLIYVLLGTVVPLPAALAAPLALSTAPAGTTYKKPAPNVIISVDDSGSMEDAGIATLREALKDTFSPGNVPNGSIRLAWQSMTRCYSIPSGGDCNNQNMMRVLDSTQRSRFMTWVDTLGPRSGTPSHRMLFNAGEYLRMAPAIDSPWASNPGTTQEPMLSCRKAYNLFMTDGGWNRTEGWSDINAAAGGTIGNSDGTSRTLGDGSTAYDVASDASQIYRDAYGGTALPTFSDLAFYYWATDLQPAIANHVPKRIAHKGDQTFTNGMASRTIPEYWNPRNDPATWQHMTTYTVGFNTAANWNATSATPKFGTDTWSGGDYAKLMLGAVAWTNPITGDETTRMPELWHAALNSRGKFIPARTAASLATAFKDVLNTIAADQTTAITSLGGSSHTTRNESKSFEGGYSADGWKGEVIAYDVAATTGAVSTTGAWGMAVPAMGDSPAKPVSTATRMDADSDFPTNRRVLSHDGTNGIAWQWSALSDAQKLALDTLHATVDSRGADRLDFIRGDRSKEVQNGGSFRDRQSRHGDIVNSRPWVVAGKPSSGYTDAAYTAFRNTNPPRTPMIYVGANDGMLHGFSALDGTEKIAYVPRGLHGALSQLTSVNYEHRYYVDGSPFTGDLSINGTWKTYLAGFLGAGGAGYFVLDVTAPGAFATATPDSLVVMDKTGPAMDPDVGHIFGDPVMDQNNMSLTQQITKLNDGRWALVTGNGFNSANEQAVLLIQYLDGAKELLKLKAGTAGGNGLGAPRLIDLNGDKMPDIAYAGDLKGSLWKFDLSSDSATEWTVAFAGAPLYLAKDAANKAQPITAAPVWQAHPNGGITVVFGTGRNLTNADRTDMSTQSAYGVYDNTAITRNASNKITLAGGGAITGGRTVLVPQTSGSASAGRSDRTQKRLWNLSSNAVNFTGANASKGWYFDLPDAGERVVRNLEWFDGQLVDIRSTVPTSEGNTVAETCGPTTTTGRDYLTTMNAITGSAPTSQIYFYTATTTIVDDPKTASRIESGLRYGVKSDTRIIDACISGSVCEERKRLGKINLRPTWRQLQ